MLSQLSVFISESEHVRFACFAASAQPPQQLWMPTSRLFVRCVELFSLAPKYLAGKKKKKMIRIQATAQSFRYSTRETYVEPFLLCVVLVKKKNSRFFLPACSVTHAYLLFRKIVEDIWKVHTHTESEREREKEREIGEIYMHMYNRPYAFPFSQISLLYQLLNTHYCSASNPNPL